MRTRKTRNIGGFGGDDRDILDVGCASGGQSTAK
jgi:hypothetical protein